MSESSSPTLKSSLRGGDIPENGASSSGASSPQEPTSAQEEIAHESFADPLEVPASPNSARSLSPAAAATSESANSAQPAAPSEFLDVEGFHVEGIEKLSEAIDKFRELELDKHIALPQLVVTGNQSCGKSSLLESLTGVPFPKGVGLCTRYTTEITLRNWHKDQVELSIDPRNSTGAIRRKRIEGFNRKRLPKLDAQSFQTLLAEIDEVFWGPKTGSVANQGPDDFAEEMLRIEISGPGLKPLKFIDTPGLYRSASQSQTERGAQVVEHLVNNLILPDRTIIVAVMESHNNVQTQDIFRLASQADTQGRRTIGVLTKCDRLEEGAQQELAAKTARNEVTVLRNGWFTVKDRSQNDVQRQVSLNQARQTEEQFFSAPEWSAIRRLGRTGMGSLKKFLGDRFCHHLKDEFPKICSEIKFKLREAKKERDALGPARSTPEQQRDFLLDVAGEFERLIEDVLANRPDPSIAWDHETKIWTRMTELGKIFQQTMRVRGHSRIFDSTSGVHSQCGGYYAGLSFQQNLNSKIEQDIEENQLHHQEIEDVGNLPTRIQKLYEDENQSDNDEDSTDPKAGDPSPKNIYLWINRQYHTSVGGVLPGLVDYDLFESLFREQTSPWHSIAVDYLGDIEVVLTNLLHYAIHRSCSHEYVHTRMDKVLKRRSKECFRQARKRLDDILRDEQRFLHSMNSSFDFSVSHARMLRFQKVLETVGKPEEGALTIKLHELRFDEAAFSQIRSTVFNLHDLLRAYYDVSLARFVNSIDRHVTRGFLLREEGPLKVLNRAWVRSLHPAALQEIAGEDLATISKRNALDLKIEQLEEAWEISAKILGPAFVPSLNSTAPRVVEPEPPATPEPPVTAAPPPQPFQADSVSNPPPPTPSHGLQPPLSTQTPPAPGNHMPGIFNQQQPTPKSERRIRSSRSPTSRLSQPAKGMRATTFPEQQGSVNNGSQMTASPAPKTGSVHTTSGFGTGASVNGSNGVDEATNVPSNLMFPDQFDSSTGGTSKVNEAEY